MYLSLFALICTATATVFVGSYLSLDQKKNELTASSHQADESVDLTYQQILILPVSSSICLVVLFFFFPYVQYLLSGLLIFGSATAVYQVFQFTLHHFMPSITVKKSNIVSFVFSVLIVIEWIRTGNFVFHNILGCCLSIIFISTVKFPSLKLAALCLSLLVVYDIFWVFFSEYFFQQNVMVSVATKQAVNPAHKMSETLHMEAVTKFIQPTLELPIKLIFPGGLNGRMMMLGLGDIALPGALVALALRCDEYFRIQSEEEHNELYENERSLLVRDVEADDEHLNVKDISPLLVSTGVADSGGSHIKSRVLPAVKKTSLFAYSLSGYFIGMISAFVGNYYSQHAQPALIYLVPGVLIPLIARAYHCSVLSVCWAGVTEKIEEDV